MARRRFSKKMNKRHLTLLRKNSSSQKKQKFKNYRSDVKSSLTYPPTNTYTSDIIRCSLSYLKIWRHMWMLPFSMYLFSFYTTKIVPTQERKLNVVQFSDIALKGFEFFWYSEVPIKRVGPNKRVGWIFIKYFCLSLCLFLSSCFLGAK